MNKRPTLDEIQFIEAACFPCDQEKISRFTLTVIDTYQSTRILLDELKKAPGEEDKSVFYKEARRLDQEFCGFIKKSGLILTWMTAHRHPDARKLSSLVMKIFEHQLFLKQLHNKNFTIKAANQSI